MPMVHAAADFKTEGVVVYSVRGPSDDQKTCVKEVASSRSYHCSSKAVNPPPYCVSTSLASEYLPISTTSKFYPDPIATLSPMWSPPNTHSATMFAASCAILDVLKIPEAIPAVARNRTLHVSW